MNRTVVLLATIGLGIALGVGGYHIYLLNTPRASRHFVASAMEWASKEVDQQEANIYVRSVATVIEAGKVATLTPPPIPTDCTNGFTYAGFDAPRNYRITTCRVTTGADGKVTVTASTASGATATAGPW